MELHPKKTMRKNYRGNKCLSCGVEVSIGSKSGFCRKHRHQSGWSEERRMQQSERMSGNKIWLGREHSVSSRQKMSKNNARHWSSHEFPEYLKEVWSMAKRGEKHWNWKGGVSPLDKIIRGSLEYRNWRESVFKRDNHTCQECGVRGVYLNADHIKPFSLYPEIRTSLSNGRTLCVPCHKKTETFAGKLHAGKKYKTYATPPSTESDSEGQSQV